MDNGGETRDQAVRKESGPNQKQKRIKLGKKEARIVAYVVSAIGFILLFVLISERGLLGKMPVTITSVSPTGEIPGTQNITIEFNYNMVGENELDAMHDNKNVAIVPELAGDFKWVTQHLLRFYPKVEMLPHTEYKITVSPDICAGKDIYLRGKRTFKFNTEPLKVINSSAEFVYEQREQIETRAEWKIEFNGRVEASKLTGSAKIYDESNASKSIPFTLKPDSGESNKFTLTSEAIEKKTIGPDQRKKIKLAIEKGLNGVGGPLGLTHTFTASMQLETDLKVYSLTPRQAEGNPYIVIEFSGPVDPRLAGEHIRVEPETEYYIESEYRNIYLKGDFKPENSYKISVSKGLISSDGSSLAEDFFGVVVAEDLEPSVSFKNKGIYLPLKGARKISVESVNLKEIHVEIEKIYLNNIVTMLKQYDPDYYYDYYYDSDSYGRSVYSGKVSVAAEKNKRVETIIDIGKFWEDGKKGIFKAIVREKEHYWNSDSLLVVVTDMGITAAMSQDDLFVMVNSLDALTPATGVQIKLWSKNNQLIASARTNSEGVATIDNLKQKMADEKYEPFAITATKGEDTAMLLFRDCRLPVTSFDVGGSKFITSGYEAFIYTDRGIYRPGDAARVAAVARGAEVSTPASFPVKLRTLDPAGKLFDETVRNLDAGGFVEFSIPVPDYARTGGYTAQLLAADEEIGRTHFFVEDFIPDKIKAVVSTDKDNYEANDEMTIKASAQSLFGPPAAGRKVKAEVTIKSFAFSSAKWKDYSFSDPDRSLDEVKLSELTGVLDDNGNIEFKTKIPEGMKPPSSLKGVVSATVTEHGGRAVSAYTDVSIHPYPYYIGMKPAKDGYAEPGKKYVVKFVAVDKSGKRIEPELLKAELFRVVYHSVLRRDKEGNYRYVSERDLRRVQAFDVDSKKTDSITVTPDDYGSYRLVVKSPEQNGMRAAMMFYSSGWGYSPWSMENPDRIEIELDKKSYKVGETAKALIKAPFPGKLLLTIEREKTLSYRTLTMTDNTATINLPVTAAHRPNVYVTAAVVKSLKNYDGVSPARAFGVAPLMVDNADRKLKVKLSAPDAIKPKTSLEIDIKVEGSSGASYVTIAAVDEGILQLVDFRTPDPFGFFYGKKRLDVDNYDVFSFILPEVRGKAGIPAGDYLESIRKKHLSPVGVRRVEPVSLWSGVVKTNSSGRAKVKFDIPQFQGRVRVMAVAANSARFGSGRTDVYVRDKISLSPVFPRFLSSGDEFSVPVAVYNGTGSDGEITVSLDVSGPASAVGDRVKKIKVSKNSERIIAFDAKAGAGIGKAVFTVKARGLGESTVDVTNVPVRPASPVVTTTGSETVKSGKDVAIDIQGGMLDGTQNARLVLSSFPSVKFLKGLRYLLQYPHGCVEQTTSKVFPLLYFDNLAKMAEPELFAVGGAAYFVKEGINKLVSMQKEDGSFSYWPGGNAVNDWASIYAAHFLVEARKAGYGIPDVAYKKMLDRLRSIARSRLDFNSDMEEVQNIVYACYVLSLAGDPPKSSISHIKDARLNTLQTSSRYQLALAFAKAGDMKTAKSLMPTEVQAARVERQTGGNFNSSVRENAIMLNVLAEIFPESPGIPILIGELSKSADSGGWYTTQDNAFAFLAIGKVLQREKNAKFKGEVVIDGKVVKKFDEKGAELESPSYSGKKVKISIKGTGNCYVYWQSWGVPSKPVFKEYDKGIRVTRDYLDINGNPIARNGFRQGELVVARIKVMALDKKLDNVVIDDMLPAGLEIENPRLESREKIPWIQKKEYSHDHMDIRDDRMLMYVNLPAREELVFHYGLRAVTKGSFTLPPVSAECMYDPSYTSIQSSGSIAVLEAK